MPEESGQTTYVLHETQISYKEQNDNFLFRIQQSPQPVHEYKLINNKNSNDR